MGQFLFQTVVRLSHLSNAETQTRSSACLLSQNKQHRGPKSSSAAGLLWSYKTKPPLSLSIRSILQHSGVTTQTIWSIKLFNSETVLISVCYLCMRAPAAWPNSLMSDASSSDTTSGCADKEDWAWGFRGNSHFCLSSQDFRVLSNAWNTQTHSQTECQAGDWVCSQCQGSELTLSRVRVWVRFLWMILMYPGGWIQASPSTCTGTPSSPRMVIFTVRHWGREKDRVMQLDRHTYWQAVGQTGVPVRCGGAAG